MKAFRFVLVVVLLSVVDISLLAAQQKNFVNVSKCSVSVSKNSGSAYKLEDVRNFVVKEIRPELSNSDNFFKVNIKSDCGNGNVVKVSLTMNGKNYYITEFNGVDLPDRIETYNNRLGVDLNKETFVSLLLDSVNYDFGKPVPDWDDWTYNEMDAVNHKQKILKMFAFVFAESARFKDAETAL